MKKTNLVYTILGFAAFAAILMSNANGRASQAGTGNTGAPGDQTVGGQARTCVSCHAGPLSTSTVIHVYQAGTTTPVTSYVPGTLYDMEVVVNHTSGSPLGYGFQIVCLKTSNNTGLTGWSSPGSNAKIATASSNNRSYVEHKGVLINNVFTFKWTAPVAGTGSVKFYAGGVSANKNNQDSGDGAAITNLTLTEATTTGLQDAQGNPLTFSVFPNPVSDVAHLTLPDFEPGDFSVSVVDMLGRVSYSRALTQEDRNTTIDVPMQNLPAGIYHITLRSGSERVSQTVLKD